VVDCVSLHLCDKDYLCLQGVSELIHYNVMSLIGNLNKFHKLVVEFESHYIYNNK